MIDRPPPPFDPDRRVPRARRAASKSARHRTLRNLAYGVLLAAAGASGATQACSSMPQPTHPATPPPGVQTPLASSLAGAAAPTTTPETPRHALDLAEFAPLFSLPGLEAAAEAYEAEDYGKSADLVREALAKRAVDALEQPRWSLLLARLDERAGRSLEAEASYARAAASPWPLTDYARLGLGRLLLARGEVSASEEALSQIPASGATFADAQLLLADAKCRNAAYAECASHLEAFLGFGSRSPGWQAESLRLAQQLFEGTPGVLTVPVATTSTTTTPPAEPATPPRPTPEVAVRALRILRALMIEAPREASAFDAPGLERRILESLPRELADQHRMISVQDQLRQVRALVDARQHDEANVTAERLFARLREPYGELACEARVLQAKVLGAQRKHEAAVARIEDVLAHCKDRDLRARALYMAGKSAFSDKRYTVADRLFAQLEAEAPKHRLADDARLYRAEAQQELGVESRFTELLTRMPEDYPKGDMVLEGVFRLALRRIQKGDWAGAAVILQRGTELAGPGDLSRGPGDAGRERYFLARALIETGDLERGLAEYEAIVKQQPLSYYMQHAYSRLSKHDEERARRALATALDEHTELPFDISYESELHKPAALRVAELLRQSDIESARRELALLDREAKQATPELWWGVALLYAKAGSTHLSHSVARWRVKRWLERWPVGSWREAWEIAFPRPHFDTVSREAEKNALDPALVYAIIREESAFNPTAVSPANAYGLMQVIPPTARWFGKLAGLPSDVQALKTPRVNIGIGTRVLSDYMSRFPKNPILGIPGYNAGPGRPKRWIKELPSTEFDVWVELIPFRETRMYTKRVLASRGAYRFLYYNDGDPGAALLLPERLVTSDT